MIKEYFSDENNYEIQFDRFEYLVNIIVTDFRINKYGRDRTIIPLGRFYRKINIPSSYHVIDDAKKEVKDKENLWGLLSSGLFDRDIHKLMPIQLYILEYISKHIF